MLYPSETEEVAKRLKILITGGAGFIGANLAHHYLSQGQEVVIVDNLSRKGTEINISWLKQKFPTLKFYQEDIVNYAFLKGLVSQAQFDVVFHLAAQVAVTTSVANPRLDFEVNALGTFNLLEAVRQTSPDAVIIFASTNKVYGDLQSIPLTEKELRYEFAEKAMKGVTEEQSLDFHSPYGCSKGAADQYVRDYARIYGLKTVCFRQSCIYGYRQFGLEDQGWLAWFIIATLKNKSLTIYGNGKQVRDVLFIDDLIKAYDLAIANKDKLNGAIYNIGGGIGNSLSLLELISILEGKFNKKIAYNFAPWRPGDQLIFISDNTKLLKEQSWQPQISYQEGIEKLIDWFQANPSYLSYLD